MTPLHDFGEALRNALCAVPLPVVRAVFLALLGGLFLWVLFLPRSSVTDPSQSAGSRVNLRPWALLSLAIQIVLYSLL